MNKKFSELNCYIKIVIISAIIIFIDVITTYVAITIFVNPRIILPNNNNNQVEVKYES